MGIYSVIKKIAVTLFFCYSCLLATGQISDVRNVNGLIAWFSADSVHLTAGNRVDTVYDKSGNGRHAVQTISQNQPLYVDSDKAIAGNSSLYFDGNDYVISRFASVFSQPNTMYIIWKEDAASVASCFSGLQTNPCNQLYYNSGVHIYAGTQLKSTFKAPFDYTLFESVFFRAGSSLYANGELLVRGDVGQQTLEGMYIGLHPVGSMGVVGNISELLVFHGFMSFEDSLLVQQYLQNKYSSKISLGDDVLIPYGFKPYTISAKQEWVSSYKWNVGENKSDITINRTGDYIVYVKDRFGLESSDTIHVEFPHVNQPDTLVKICADQDFVWNTGLSETEYSFKWNTGDTDSFLTISSPGKYWVKIIDKEGYMWMSDTVNVFVDSLKYMSVFENDVLKKCKGDFIETSLHGDYFFTWVSDGFEGREHQVDTSGVYGLAVSSKVGCGDIYEEVSVIIKGENPVAKAVFASENFCDGNTIDLLSNSYSVDNTDIVSTTWFVEQDTLYGEIESYVFPQSGEFSVTLLVENEVGCIDSIVENVHIHPRPVASFSPLIACQYTEREITSTSKIADGEITTYSWEVDGKSSSEKSVQVLSDEVRMIPAKLTVTSDQGCTATKEDEIQVVPSTKITLVHKDVCVGDTVLFFDATEYPVYNAQQEAYWLIDHTQKRSYSPLLPYITTDTTTHIVELYAKTFNGCMNIGRDTLRPYAIPEPRMDTLYTCVGSEIILKNSGVSRDNIASYVWNIADSLTFTEEKPSFVLQRSGLFPVSLQVTTEAGCQAATTSAIVIDAQPQADFTFFPKKGAEPLFVNFTNESKHAVAYTWTFEQKEVETIEDPSYLFTDKETSYAKLVAHSVHDCRDSITKRIPLTLADEQLQITDVRTTIDANGFVSYFVQILNSGNVAINNIELLLSTPDIASLAESWNGTLEPGTVLDYVFAAKTKSINGTLPKYVCVTAEIVSPEEYKVYFSDNFCMDQTNEFTVYYVAPNPVGKEATVAFNVKRKGTIVVSCIDENGKIRISKEWNDIEAGYHTITMDTMELPSGRYVLVIAQDNQKQQISFVK